MTNFSPREIVSELDRYIIGQADAKRAVAIALRNRWRRQQLEGPLKDEVLPKNILMIGPTGVGKTEISRRLLQSSQARPSSRWKPPSLPKWATSAAMSTASSAIWSRSGITLVREAKRMSTSAAQAEKNAEERVLDASSAPPHPRTRESFGSVRRNNELSDKEIEIHVADQAAHPCRCSTFPACPAAPWAQSTCGDLLGKASGRALKAPPRHGVKDSHDLLIAEESDKLIDTDQITSEAIRAGREQRHRLPG